MPFETKVWMLSRDAVGCRRLQEILQSASEEEKQTIRRELIGRVSDAIECKHCNHVLQKLIVEMNPQDSKFVIDEIVNTKGSAAYVAQHLFGCRVIERLLEHCKADDLKPLIEDILSNSHDLCMNQFGNYVMQHLLEHGQKEHRHHIAGMLVEQKENTLFTDYHAGNVVAHALTHCSQPDRCLVAHRLLRDKGLIVSMARQRHGHLAVENLLQIPGDVGQKAWELLSQKISELRSSRYGRAVEKAMLKMRTYEEAAELAATVPVIVPAS